MSDTNSSQPENKGAITPQEQREKDLTESNELLARQLEELRREKSINHDDAAGQKNTGNRLSFISDFFGSLLSSLGSNHAALSANFGGGVRGAILGALYQSFFISGIIGASYVFYQVTNMQEQSVYIPNEESSR
jgi:hypothetical protein